MEIMEINYLNTEQGKVYENQENYSLTEKCLE